MKALRSHATLTRSVSALALLICSVFSSQPKPLAGSASAPAIVEFGPSFRSALRGIAVAPDGAIWIEESDGAARLARDGRITQIRRADEDCDDCLESGIGIGPDGAVWTNGGDRLLRFEGDTVRPVARQITMDYPYRYRYRAFAATAAGIDVARFIETGIRRVDGDTVGARLFGQAGYVSQIAVGSGATIWLVVNPSPYQQNYNSGTTLVSSVAGTEHRGLAADYLRTHSLREALTVGPDQALFAIVQAGSPALEDHNAAGPAFDAQSIIRVSPTGDVREIARLPRKAYFWPLGSLAAGADGDVWFTVPDGNRIGRITASGDLEEFRNGIPLGASPGAIAVDRDGSVWFTDTSRSTVEHRALDGRVTVFGNGLSPINTPGAPAATSDGAVWFLETLSWHPRIARIASDGSVTEFQNPFTPVRGYVALQAAGRDVIVINTGYYGSVVRPMAMRVTPSGTTSSVSFNGCLVSSSNFACFPQLRGRGVLHHPFTSPSAVVRGPDHNLWFTDPVNDTIGRVDARGHFDFFRAGLTRWHSGPQHITVGPDGALWFTEIRDRIGRITTSGKITEFSGKLPFRSFVGGIVTGRDGNLWFTLYHGNELVRMTPAGAITRFRDGIYPSSGNDDTIDSVPTLDHGGRVWFNEPQGGRIARATIPL